jgi:hypothetical protein
VPECSHQATLKVDTIMQASKLRLTTLYVASYLISQAKTAISSLALMSHLGAHIRTAWLIHSKVM